MRKSSRIRVRPLAGMAIILDEVQAIAIVTIYSCHRVAIQYVLQVLLHAILRTLILDFVLEYFYTAIPNYVLAALQMTNISFLKLNTVP